MDLSENTAVALEPLYVGNARAHNRGDLVPVENVERNGWTELVAAHGTDEAKLALGFDPYTDGVAVEADDARPPSFDVNASIDRVKAWVGESPERAATALGAEQAKGDAARPTLVDWLSKVPKL